MTKEQKWDKFNKAKTAYKTPFWHSLPNNKSKSKEELRKQLADAAANTEKQQSSNKERTRTSDKE
jgi:hypothetical protein